MNHYELLVLIAGTYAETEIPAIVSHIEQLLKKNETKVSFVEPLGKKKLAYEIAHNTFGYYVLCEFDADPKNVAALDRDFRLSSELLRHQIISKKHVGKPMGQASQEDIARIVDKITEEPEEESFSEVIKSQEPTEQIESSPSSEEPKKESGEKTEKKGKKSHEDLNKKLDDILNSDDII